MYVYKSKMCDKYKPLDSSITSSCYFTEDRSSCKDCVYFSAKNCNKEVMDVIDDENYSLS